MNLLIVKNDYYIDSLRMNPGQTIYKKIDLVDSFHAVKDFDYHIQKFMNSRPAYVAELLQRVPREYQQYTKYERPDIYRMQSSPVYTHSAAAPYEIDILKVYQRVQSSLRHNAPKINVKA